MITGRTASVVRLTTDGYRGSDLIGLHLDGAARALGGAYAAASAVVKVDLVALP
jgi:hypothetical protein